LQPGVVGGGAKGFGERGFEVRRHGLNNPEWLSYSNLVVRNVFEGLRCKAGQRARRKRLAIIQAVDPTNKKCPSITQIGIVDLGCGGYAFHCAKAFLNVSCRGSGRWAVSF
jgi:hypothetical protein